MNIGNRPTFSGDHQTLETHILHFHGNLYGQRLAVWFISRLRPEKKFVSEKALASQMESDVHQAEEKLNKTIEI